ncbi:hypothetical protein [Parageobacillus toebii]|nr:hypothetical protein [Parageobacillus toebii]
MLIFKPQKEDRNQSVFFVCLVQLSPSVSQPFCIYATPTNDEGIV